MADHTYIVTFDVTDPAVDVEGLKDFVTTSPLIDGWWNHIPSVFLLTSDATPARLSREIKRFTGDARLLVMAVDPAASEGWLPERSWSWIKRRSPPSKAGALLEKLSTHDDGSGV